MNPNATIYDDHLNDGFGIPAGDVTVTLLVSCCPSVAFPATNPLGSRPPQRLPLGGCLLNGTKSLICLGAWAGHVSVLARAEDEQGR